MRIRSERSATLVKLMKRNMARQEDLVVGTLVSGVVPGAVVTTMPLGWAGDLTGDQSIAAS